jgi:adenylosuccinate lyase
MNIISPLDDRYASQISDISVLFSNFGFTKYKLLVECEYLIFIVSIVDPSNTDLNSRMIRDIYTNFNEIELDRIKEYEENTNHDIQALIEYLKSRLPESLKRWVHFGLTSQDINSPAMVLSYRDFNNTILCLELDKLTELLTNLTARTQDAIMVTFTHGQPATPSTFGKQMIVFVDKLNHLSSDLFNSYDYRTKMGGSNGDLTGLKFCFPNINWNRKISEFLYATFELGRNTSTTQVDDYMNYFKLFQIYERLCYLLINLSQDMWLYVHKKYLKLSTIKTEVGSSAMPHKVNPIHFENAEGNLKIAANLFHTIGSSIVLSRMQRDLTDSTILRNVGVACGHMVLAIRNICTGLNRVEINLEELSNEIDNNEEIFMEFYQLKLRQWDIPDAYNICKNFARGNDNFVLSDFVGYLEKSNINLSNSQLAEFNMDIDNIIKNI